MGINYDRMEYSEEEVNKFATAIKELFGNDVFEKFGEWCLQNDYLQTEGVLVTTG